MVIFNKDDFKDSFIHVNSRVYLCHFHPALSFHVEVNNDCGGAPVTTLAVNGRKVLRVG